MNNNDLNRLANNLLTAFLDKAPSSEIGAICAKFGIIPGSKIFHKATDRAIEWIEKGEFDLLDDSNRDKLTQQGLSNLSLFYHSQNSKIVRNCHKCYLESDCERFYC